VNDADFAAFEKALHSALEGPLGKPPGLRMAGKDGRRVDR
jgi:hypothetical protein